MSSILEKLCCASALVALTASAVAEPLPAPDAPPTSVDALDVDAAFASSEPLPGAGAPPRAASMNPDLTVFLDVAGAYFSHDEHRQTGAHDPTRTGFNLQQLEMSLGSTVDPYFRFDSNLIFSLEGVEIEEAYATTLELPARLQLRAGQFLWRFGRFNATHPHVWHFVDQPFTLGRLFGGEGGRGLGVELSWLLPLPWFAEVVASVHHAEGEGTARSFYGEGELGVHGLDDLLYVTALKQFFDLAPEWSLEAGASGAFGPNSSGRQNRTDLFGADLFLKFRPSSPGSSTVVSLETEWVLRRRQLPFELLQDFGGTTQLFYRFARRWGTALRWEYGSAAEGVGASVVDPLDPDWTGARQRWSANVTFWPSEFSRLRLQGSRDDFGAPGPVWAAFLAAEFVVGAHAPHEF